MSQAKNKSLNKRIRDSDDSTELQDDEIQKIIRITEGLRMISFIVGIRIPVVVVLSVNPR